MEDFFKPIWSTGKDGATTTNLEIIKGPSRDIVIEFPHCIPTPKAHLQPQLTQLKGGTSWKKGENFIY